MNQSGKHNQEYMAVLTEVVHCLIHQLHHPKLTMDAKQVADWFHHVTEEQVEEVLHRTTAEDRHGGGMVKGQQHA